MVSDSSPLNAPLPFATTDNRHTSTTENLFTAANEPQLSTTQSPPVLLLAVPAQLRDKIISAPSIQKNNTEGQPKPRHIPDWPQQACIAASCNVGTIVSLNQPDACTNPV